VDAVLDADALSALVVTPPAIAPAASRPAAANHVLVRPQMVVESDMA
jgi:hypothetical protein